MSMISFLFCHVIQALCLNSIYEDLKLYQLEFKNMNAQLLMDPQRQIFLDQNMLSAIDELIQVRAVLLMRALFHAEGSHPGFSTKGNKITPSWTKRGLNIPPRKTLKKGCPLQEAQMCAGHFFPC